MRKGEELHGKPAGVNAHLRSARLYDPIALIAAVGQLARALGAGACRRVNGAEYARLRSLRKGPHACKSVESMGRVKGADELPAFGKDVVVALILGQIVQRVADITSGRAENEISPKSGLDKDSLAQFGIRGGKDGAGSQRARACGGALEQEVPEQVNAA